MLNFVVSIPELTTCRPYFKAACNRNYFTMIHQFELWHCLQVATREDYYTNLSKSHPDTDTHTHTHTHTHIHTHHFIHSIGLVPHTYILTDDNHQAMEKLLWMLSYMLRSVKAWF